MVNVCVLAGELSSVPQVRVLDSGTRLMTLQVRVRASEGLREGDSVPATSVPVAVWDPPARLEGLGEADPVLVVGVVHRRFFRLRDGRTGSRVEVVAASVLKPTERKRLEAALRRVYDRLADLEDGNIAS